MQGSCSRMSCLIFVSWILIGLVGPRLAAQGEPSNWLQFRGPGGLGVSPAKGLPLKWGPKENIVWKSELPGPGSSSPIIVGDKIFLTCYSGFNVPGKQGGDMEQLKLHLVCLSRSRGTLLWSADIAPRLPEQARIRENHGYASSTAVSDGERVYVFFGKSGVFAFDFGGKQLWRADVGSGLNDWGSATSPVLHGDLLIVNASIESQSLRALDKKTGKEVWRANGIREAWNTPVLVPLKGGKTELVVAMPRTVLGFDPASGERLWSCATEITWYIVPSIVAHDETLWSLGGRSGVVAVALRAGGRGDVTRSHRLWTSRNGANVISPIIHEGHLYWVNDMEMACCAEAKTGKIVYEERLPRVGQVWASPILAEGRLYYVARTGRTCVVAANPKFEVLATNDLGDRSTFNASPAVAGNQLFLRSDRFLYCLGRQ